MLEPASDVMRRERLRSMFRNCNPGGFGFHRKELVNESFVDTCKRATPVSGTRIAEW